MKRHAILPAGLLFWALATSACLAEEVLLVVNKANPASSVSEQDAQNIFLGKKTTWNDGRKIVILNQSNARVTESFAKSITNKTAQQYATYWKKALFTGTGTPPKTVEDDAAVKNYIASNKDAVGYISASALDGSVKKLDVR